MPTLENAKFLQSILPAITAAPDPCPEKVITFAVFLAEQSMTEISLSTLADLLEKTHFGRRGRALPEVEVKLLGMIESRLKAIDLRNSNADGFTAEAGAVLERLAAVFLQTVQSTGMAASQFRNFGAVLALLIPLAATFVDRLRETLLAWATEYEPQAPKDASVLATDPEASIKAENVVPLQRQIRERSRESDAKVAQEERETLSRPLAPKKRIVQLCKAFEASSNDNAAAIEEDVGPPLRRRRKGAATTIDKPRRRRRSENAFIDEGLEEMEAEGDSDGYEDLEGFVVCPGDSTYFQ
ncbi:Hypothetical Protein FCC1311_042822 [Hondaea fermentalgiana]|uniref:Uncharacterized protein n=1 Tax=Hondaea fermentalgiana TaxID=2315210 RepID=A0A2R5GCJ6_9STRA|nr:Hypothetical Protein FCC1311_042822 [Hondaea fermentalgiana]|eukprot:GBG28059.1 Hypothetical Protein FCC1311_042822 [Hondaea fermentalgiana]